MLICEESVTPVLPMQLKATIAEVLSLQESLDSDGLDSQLLSDFRNALNRVRNVAWAAHNKPWNFRPEAASPARYGIWSLPSGCEPHTTFAVQIQDDLTVRDIDFQKGQLAELHTVALQLAHELSKRI